MLGIIGGTGLYKIDGLDIKDEKEIKTPFGLPSASLVRGEYGGREVVFLPRHGVGHSLLPSEINYRANIWALKKLGAKKLVSISATGSLREEINPGDICVPSQYFDHTSGKREGTFFGNGIVAHISTAKPSCESLTSDIIKAGKKIGIKIHTEKTYGCVEGPRLGTKAESLFLRNAGCDVVGMTNVPEVFLAREAQLPYCTIAIVTDYDCWLDDPSMHASVETAMKNYVENIGKVKNLLKKLLTDELTISPDYCTKSLAGAIVTPGELMNESQREIVEFLTS